MSRLFGYTRAMFTTAIVLLLLPQQALIQTKAPPFESEIKAYETQDAKQPPKPGGIVFVGSSSIRGWRTLSKDFPRHNVINRGFGGSQLHHSVFYAHRIVTPYRPIMVVVFAGTNDIAAGKSGEQVASDFQQFVTAVRSKLPATRIAYISVSPAPSRWQSADKMRTANRLIRQACVEGENLAFVDVFSLMLDAEGKPMPELFGTDQLHMNAKGYGIWKKAVAPFLPWPS